MTIVLPVHRAISAKLAGRSFNAVSRLTYNPWLARVNSTGNDKDVTYSSSYERLSRIGAASTRSYATTATSKATGKPKAHTGRTTATRTTKTKSTTKKPGPKTAAGKAKVGRKPKKAAKKKPVAKKVKKPKSKSALLQERRSKVKEATEAALLTEPKKLPATPWTLVFTETTKSAGKGEFGGTAAKDAATKYRNLSLEEKEHYNHIANQNKATNESEHKKWVAQYTPEQILKANLARKQLQKDWLARHPKRKQTQKFPPIQDDRLVKGVVGPYIIFHKERYASGDFARMTAAESAKLIGREWKALSATERKKYEDQGKADQNRYYEEYKTVYGHDAPQVKQSAKSRTTKTAAV